MDNDYLVEIEYVAKKVIPIKALSQQWAEIVAKEQWEQTHTESIVSIKVKENK